MPPAVVADANVIISALIGGRARLVFAARPQIVCFATQHVAAEISRNLPPIVERKGLDLPPILAALAVMRVRWMPADAYASYRAEAERRMAQRDPTDWPTVALALARSLPIWSQDKDLEQAGIELWTTGRLLDALRERDP